MHMNLVIEDKNHQSEFEKLAFSLLADSVLLIKNHEYQICEIEFYLHSKNHPDTYTHQSEAQSQPNRWYFHKVGKGYKEGTYKGLDVTFGTEGKSSGGILIRSIYDISNDKMVTGPSKVVDEILTHFKLSKVFELAKELQKTDQDLLVDNLSELTIKEKKLEVKDLCSTYRIGLKPKVAITKSFTDTYLMKDYRFVSLNYIRGIKHKAGLILALYLEGKNVEEIHKILNSPNKSIKGMIDSYLFGKQGNIPLDFKSKYSTKNQCQMYGSL